MPDENKKDWLTEDQVKKENDGSLCSPHHLHGLWLAVMLLLVFVSGGVAHYVLVQNGRLANEIAAVNLFDQWPFIPKFKKKMRETAQQPKAPLYDSTLGVYDEKTVGTPEQTTIVPIEKRSGYVIVEHISARFPDAWHVYVHEGVSRDQATLAFMSPEVLYDMMQGDSIGRMEEQSIRWSDRIGFNGDDEFKAELARLRSDLTYEINGREEKRLYNGITFYRFSGEGSNFVPPPGTDYYGLPGLNNRVVYLAAYKIESPDTKYAAAEEFHTVELSFKPSDVIDEKTGIEAIDGIVKTMTLQ